MGLAGLLGWVAIGVTEQAQAAPERPAAPERRKQKDDDVFDSWARWVTHQARWRGQTVRQPDPQPRPPASQSQVRLDSALLPVHVHGPAWLAPARAAQALSAAERALQYLMDLGFPQPPSDGMRGGTAGFDVYLAGPHLPNAGGGQPLAQLDADDPLSLQDGAITFAVVDAGAPDLEACVIAGVSEAALLAADPAEASTWRQATAAFVAWHLTGIAGCDPSTAEGSQRPERGFGHAAAGPGGVSFLRWLNGRVGREAGRFLGELWHFSRQDSRGARFLRGSPDLWEALDRALQNAGQPLEALLLEAAQHRATRRPPLRMDLSWASLPRHVYPEPGLWPLGSSYTRIRIESAPAQAQLRVWLRGELGPRWSLTAVQLDAMGRELGRLSAPARRTPKSYLPILLEAATREVVLTVTRLPVGLPDADLPESHPAFYKLIVDRGP